MFPKCLVKPLLAFILLIVILFILAFTTCFFTCNKSADSTCKKDCIKEEITIVAPEPEIVEPEPEVIAPEPVENALEKIKNDFNNGIIADGYTHKISVFFDRNSAFMTQDSSVEFENIKNQAADSKLVLINGFACDLGNAEYNKALIQKRIESVVIGFGRDFGAEIYSSNDGQIAGDDKAQNRRVDIYFYK